MIVGLGLPAVLSGCGGSSETPAKEVRDAAAAYEKALADGGAARACELTYLNLPGTRRDRPLKEGEVQSCTRDAEMSLRDSPLAFEPKVGKVRVRGTTATAELRAPAGSPGEQLARRSLELRRFGDDWKVSFEPG